MTGILQVAHENCNLSKTNIPQKKRNNNIEIIFKICAAFLGHIIQHSKEGERRLLKSHLQGRFNFLEENVCSYQWGPGFSAGDHSRQTTDTPGRPGLTQGSTGRPPTHFWARDSPAQCLWLSSKRDTSWEGKWSVGPLDKVCVGEFSTEHILQGRWGGRKKNSVTPTDILGAKACSVKTHTAHRPPRRTRRGSTNAHDRETRSLPACPTRRLSSPALGGLQRQQQPEGGFRRVKRLFSLPPSLIVRRGFTGRFSGAISQGCFSPLCPPPIFTNSFIGNMSPLLPLPTVQGGFHVQGLSGVVAENTQPAKLKMLSGQPLAERLAPGCLVGFYLIKTPHLSQALPLPPLLVLQTWGSLQGRQPGCPSRRRQTERNTSSFISSDCRWHWRGHIHPWAPGVYLGGRWGASHFKQEVWRRASPGPWAAHWSWHGLSVTTSLAGRDTEAWRRFLGGCSTLCLFVPQHLPIFGVKGGACICSNFGWRACWDLAT